MDALKVQQHNLPTFVGISAEIMLSVEGVEKPIALLERGPEKGVKIIERLSVIVLVLKELAKRMPIDGAENISSTRRILVFQ